MSLMEYRTILRYRLMILLFSIHEVCYVCRKACLDIFWENVVHSTELSDLKYKFDFDRDALFNIFRQTEVFVKRETSVNT